mgnify:CR=1 FL=1
MTGKTVPEAKKTTPSRSLPVTGMVGGGTTIPGGFVDFNLHTMKRTLTLLYKTIFSFCKAKEIIFYDKHKSTKSTKYRKPPGVEKFSEISTSSSEYLGCERRVWVGRWCQQSRTTKPVLG